MGLWLATTATAEIGCSDPCASPGAVCRVAGTGGLGFNGDGLPARETEFYLVSAVRVGVDQHVYLMDYNNHRLRAIDPDGRVRTVAGNGEHAVALAGVPPTQSGLENPIDFAFAPSGEIVLVPLHDARVLGFTPNGVLRVIAGSGALGDEGDGASALEASFWELSGIVVGPDRSVYVADGGAFRVRVIRPDGIIRAYAGSGAPGYEGDGGPAVAARLGRPEGMALDGLGNLYIADSGAHVIRRVRPDGIIETVAGTGEPGFSGDGGPAKLASLRAPEGVAVAADGTLYLSDSANHRIRQVTPDGTISTIAGTGQRGLSGDGGPALQAQLTNPSRLALDGDKLYVADLMNSCARVLRLR